MKVDWIEAFQAHIQTIVVDIIPVTEPESVECSRFSLISIMLLLKKCIKSLQVRALVIHGPIK